MMTPKSQESAKRPAAARPASDAAEAPIPSLSTLPHTSTSGAGRATAGGLAAIALWSSTVALARSLSESLGPLTAGAAVYLGAGALAAAGDAMRPKAPRGGSALRHAPILICGALFVGYALLLFLALGLARDRMQAVEVGLVNYLWPALTLWFSIGLLGHRAHWALAPATAIGVAGVWLVLTHETAPRWSAAAGRLMETPLPYALGATAAVVWALYSNLTRRWRGALGTGAVRGYLIATGLGLALLSLTAEEPRRWSAGVAAEAGALALATWLAYGLWERAMMRGNVALVAAASYFTPLLSTLVTCAYLAIRPGGRLWFGCALLIAGAALSKWAVREDANWRKPPMGVPSSDQGAMPNNRA